MEHDSEEYRIYQEVIKKDDHTLTNMKEMVYSIIQSLKLPANITIGMYFKDAVGYIKHSIKEEYTLLGRVIFKNPLEYPCIMDGRKALEGINEDDDYAIVDLSHETEAVSMIYGMNIPSEEEINLFNISLFPIVFEAESAALKEAVSSDEPRHFSKSICISKFIAKNDSLEIKTCKGRSIIKKRNIPVKNIHWDWGDRFESSVSSSLLESVVFGDQTIVRMHQGMTSIESKFDGKLLNFNFIIYKNKFQEI